MNAHARSAICARQFDDFGHEGHHPTAVPLGAGCSGGVIRNVDHFFHVVQGSPPELNRNRDRNVMSTRLS